MFQTIKENTIAEIVEKKSKFIAHAFYIESVEEAETILANIKKEYRDARHNCYAYRVIEEEQVLSKNSDDGEPSGTAGAPMLTILERNGLTNVLVVVTRYFGGILLGTGGLVRAYSEATTAALEKTEWIQKELGYEMKVEIGYADLENFQYFCRKHHINRIKEEYLETVGIVIECDLEQSKLFQQNEINSNIKLLKSEIIRKKYVEKNIEK